MSFESASNKAIDCVYDLVDELLLAGEFALVNEFCRTWSVSYNLDITLSFLTITAAADDKLPERAGLYQRAVDHYGDGPLFQGLEPTSQPACEDKTQ